MPKHNPQLHISDKIITVLLLIYQLDVSLFKLLLYRLTNDVLLHKSGVISPQAHEMWLALSILEGTVILLRVFSLTIFLEKNLCLVKTPLLNIFVTGIHPMERSNFSKILNGDERS